MNYSSHVYAIVTSTLIFIAHFQSSAMVVSASCLKRCLGQNKITGLILIGHRHAWEPNQLVNKGHMEDMHKLLSITSNSKYTVPFLVEISEAHKDKTRQANTLDSPENVAIKIALNNNMHYNAINFVPFDHRPDIDFMVRDMIYHFYEIFIEIKRGRKHSDFFYTITTKNFLKHLDKRYEENSSLIQRLPLTKERQDHYLSLNKHNHQECYDKLFPLLEKYNIRQEQHILLLIQELNTTEVTDLYHSLAEENCFSIDINIMQKSLSFSESYPLSIISSGAYHSSNIEKWLLSNSIGFEKDTASSLSLPGFKADSLSTISFPTNAPAQFMNKNMESFIYKYLNE